MLAVVRFSVVGCLAGLDGAFSSVKLGNELEKPRVFSHCCIDHRWLGDLFYNHGSFTPNTVNNQRFSPVNNQIDLQLFFCQSLIRSYICLFYLYEIYFGHFSKGNSTSRNQNTNGPKWPKYNFTKAQKMKEMSIQRTNIWLIGISRTFLSFIFCLHVKKCGKLQIDKQT